MQVITDATCRYLQSRYQLFGYITLYLLNLESSNAWEIISANDIGHSLQQAYKGYKCLDYQLP